MKGKPLKRNTYTIGVATVLEMPEQLAVCPHCGGEVGLWSEAIETECIFCGQTVLHEVMSIH